MTLHWAVLLILLFVCGMIIPMSALFANFIAMLIGILKSGAIVEQIIVGLIVLYFTISYCITVWAALSYGSVLAALVLTVMAIAIYASVAYAFILQDNTRR